jgi:LmbE family N-acetylglucosaminyl deacetylase
MNILSEKTALVFCAHQDDAELGLGGTIVKLATAGWEVHVVILTRASDPVIAQQRAIEAEKGAQILGVAKLEQWNIETGHLREDDRSLIQRLQILVGTLKPVLVFCHTPHDNHQDHRAVANLVASAAKQQTVLHYAVSRSYRSEFAQTARLCVNVTKYAATKQAAFEEHHSQLNKVMPIEFSRFDARTRLLTGLDQAELFHARFPSPSYFYTNMSVADAFRQYAMPVIDLIDTAIFPDQFLDELGCVFYLPEWNPLLMMARERLLRKQQTRKVQALTGRRGEVSRKSIA